MKNIRKALVILAAACWAPSWAQTVGGLSGISADAAAAAAAAAGTAGSGMVPSSMLPAGAGPAGASLLGGAPGAARAAVLGGLAQSANAAAGSDVGSGAQAQNVRPDLGGAPALGVTQFQQFVQAASGRALPLFGYELFDRGRFPSVTDVPVPANYVLGPGDEIDLKIWGSVDVAIRLPVDRHGQISVPKVGPVSVAGVRSSEMDAHIKKQVSRVFKNFELSATVGKLRTIQIFVVGQARNPGAYTVSSLSNLIGAIFESGGPSATGSMRSIQLVRSGKTMATVDLYKFIQSGQTGAGQSQEGGGDTRLLPGDVIVVPPAGARVALSGALDNPAIFELSAREEPLSQVLSYSASSQTLLTPHKVLLERVDSQKAKAPREVQELALDESGLKSMVRAGDLITLFKISPQFSNAVTLRGNVAAPLRYAYKPGMKVSDLIPEVEALILSDYYTRKNILVQYESGKDVSNDRLVSEVRTMLAEINWDYASVERMDKKEVKTQLIPFNLGRAVKQKDPASDLLLQPGDVVTIFGVDDIPVPLEKRSQFVKVVGEVKVPGIYQIQPGDTLPKMIAKAGGLASSAYLYGTVFTRETTRVQQQANLEQAIRKMEQQISSQGSAMMQNITDAEKGQTVQAQLAGQRMSLERLKGLKANGRIALELDPNELALPAIGLEDGDVISVPRKPSFVSVFGAVLAETTFIHRTGSTVRDYLDRAGITRDADLDAAMVIRSDGTVLSNMAQRSVWGLGYYGFMGTKIYPGDSVFVPEMIDKRTAFSKFIEGAKDWTQLFYQFGLGAAAVKTLKN